MNFVNGSSALATAYTTLNFICKYYSVFFIKFCHCFCLGSLERFLSFTEEYIVAGNVPVGRLVFLKES